jgi:very-short-patch-repair endonuclease
VADERGRRIGKPDLLCEELAVVGEYDGADHREARRQADDVAKEDDFRNVGLECFRVVGRDIDDVSLVVRRMRGAVQRAAEAGRPSRWTIRKNPGPL